MDRKRPFVVLDGQPQPSIDISVMGSERKFCSCYKEDCNRLGLWKELKMSR